MEDIQSPIEKTPVPASLVDKLKGAFDLTFLFGRGIVPFENDPSRAAGLKSLWICVALLPLDFICPYYFPPEGLDKQPMRVVMTISLASQILGMVLGTLLLWVAAIAFNRRDRFWLTFQALNWSSVPMTIISLPIFLLAVNHWYPRSNMEHVFTIITYYGVIVNGCVLYRGLKIDWMFAGFLACMGIFIGQQIWNLLFWLNGVPINWG